MGASLGEKRGYPAFGVAHGSAMAMCLDSSPAWNDMRGIEGEFMTYAQNVLFYASVAYVPAVSCAECRMSYFLLVLSIWLRIAPSRMARQARYAFVPLISSFFSAKITILLPLPTCPNFQEHYLQRQGGSRILFLGSYSSLSSGREGVGVSGRGCLLSCLAPMRCRLRQVVMMLLPWVSDFSPAS